MFIRRLLAKRRERRSVTALAQTVAEMSAAAIMRLVAETARGMSPCEARGYIRARAAGEIRSHATAVLAELPDAVGLEGRVARQAADRATTLVLRQLLAAGRRPGMLSESASASACRQAA